MNNNNSNYMVLYQDDESLVCEASGIPYYTALGYVIDTINGLEEQAKLSKNKFERFPMKDTPEMNGQYIQYKVNDKLITFWIIEHDSTSGVINRTPMFETRRNERRDFI